MATWDGTLDSESSKKGLLQLYQAASREYATPSVCNPIQAVAGAGSVEELRTLLAELELSVHAEYVSPHFRHTPPAVPGAWLPPAAPPQPEAAPEGSAAAAKAEASEAAQRLAWLPATAAAVSLRLAAFDAAVVYEPGMPPARDTLQVRLTCSVAVCHHGLSVSLHAPVRQGHCHVCAICDVLQNMHPISMRHYWGQVLSSLTLLV